MANATAANGAGGSRGGHLNADELLYGGSDSYFVVHKIASLERLALGDCCALDEVHGDIATGTAREAKVNIGDVEDARRVVVHDVCDISLCAAFASDEGTIAIFDPESRIACDLHADTIPKEICFST